MIALLMVGAALALDCDDAAEPLALVATRAEDGAAPLGQEGESLVFTASGGCYAGLAWAISDDTLADCTYSADALRCVLRDDGALTVSVVSLDEAGLSLESSSLYLDILNVAPQIRAGLGRETELLLGETFSGSVLVDEPGSDTLTYTLSGGPAGLVLDADGAWSYEVVAEDVGTWAMVLTVEDDDGAFDRQTSVLYILPVYDSGGDSSYDTASVSYNGSTGHFPKDDDSSGGCAASLGFLLLLFPSARRRAAAGIAGVIAGVRNTYTLFLKANRNIAK